MKILSITAGAAGMYCGSCLRDNALAAELKSLGHEIVLLPLYTPTLTDESNVSENRVFFGGISVYLQQHTALFRKTPWFVDRLWDSSFAIKAATHFSVSTDPQLLGDLTISMLEGENGFQKKEIQKLLHWLKSQPAPDVITLPNSLLIGLAASLKQALNRPVVCTLQGEDLFLDGLEESHKTKALDLIRNSVSLTDGFVAVSHYYARFMSDLLEIPEEKTEVVPLGINLDGFEPRDATRTGPFTIGYFARVAPEKGLHNLCEAFRSVRKTLPNARLEVAGYLGPEHKGYLAKLEKQMEEWGLGGELHYRGALDRQQKIEFLRGLDVVSVPSGYIEPKGIYLLEAMACGVPVVQPRHGAFPEIIEKTGGGILVDSEEGTTVAEGIISLAKNPAMADELGRKGAEGVRAHYSVGQMARRSVEVYEGFIQSARHGGRDA